MEKDQIQNQIANQDTRLLLPAASQSKSDLVLLLRSLCYHPFLLWGSLWVLLLIIINVALSTFLLNPEFVVQSEQIQESPVQEPPAVVVPETPAPISVESKDSLPIWSFGAIACSCAIATLMISQRLRQPPRRRKPTKRSAAARTIPATPVAPSKGAIAPTHSKLTAPRQPASALQFSGEETPVSVVPTDESHSLDWDEASLADSLDIRYRRPLSSWR